MKPGQKSGNQAPARRYRAQAAQLREQSAVATDDATRLHLSELAIHYVSSPKPLSGRAGAKMFCYNPTDPLSDQRDLRGAAPEDWTRRPIAGGARHLTAIIHQAA